MASGYTTCELLRKNFSRKTKSVPITAGTARLMIQSKVDAESIPMRMGSVMPPEWLNQIPKKYTAAESRMPSSVRVTVGTTESTKKIREVMMIPSGIGTGTEKTFSSKRNWVVKTR